MTTREKASVILLTVLEGRRQEEHDDVSTRIGRPDEPSAFSIHAPTVTGESWERKEPVDG